MFLLFIIILVFNQTLDLCNVLIIFAQTKPTEEPLRLDLALGGGPAFPIADGEKGMAIWANS
jgi:hypothetical protein